MRQIHTFGILPKCILSTHDFILPDTPIFTIYDPKKSVEHPNRFKMNTILQKKKINHPFVWACGSFSTKCTPTSTHMRACTHTYTQRNTHTHTHVHKYICLFAQQNV